jgi:hypothetical protein
VSMISANRRFSGVARFIASGGGGGGGGRTM